MECKYIYKYEPVRSCLFPLQLGWGRLGWEPALLSLSICSPEFEIGSVAFLKRWSSWFV